MNFLELATLPMEYQQKAPIGYLWSSRLFVVLFGNSEMALRLFSLLCGLASLYFFLPVCRYFLKSKPAIAIAIGILALSPPLVYHAVEAKQYSTELLGTVLSLYLYIRYHKRTSYQSLFVWGLLGGIILWFSFSSIFILAGIAGAISLVNLIKRDWKSFFIFLIPFVIWMFSFALNYFLFTYKHSDTGWLVLWFQKRGGFMPANDLLGSISWLLDKPFSLLHFPLGLSWFFLPKEYDNYLLVVLSRMAFVPFFLLVIGVIYSFKKRFNTFLILMIPLLLHLLATLLMIYPFFERLTVYLAPLIILLLGFGCEKFLLYFSKSDNRTSEQQTASPRGSKSLGLYNRFNEIIRRQKWSTLIILLLLLGPLMHSTKDLIFTDSFGRFKHWHQRELYQYLNANFKDGDVVYIYWNSLVPYNYYQQVNNYKFKAVEGKDYRFTSTDFKDYLKKLESDIKPLKNHKRVWLIYANARDIKIGEIDNQPVWYYKGKDHLKMKRAEFNSIGKQIDHYKTKENMDLYLFEPKN